MFTSTTSHHLKKKTALFFPTKYVEHSQNFEYKQITNSLFVYLQFNIHMWLKNNELNGTKKSRKINRGEQMQFSNDCYYEGSVFLSLMSFPSGGQQ